ncbi:MAG: metal ABC transporter permease [Gemmatimonas sp.]|nr:metal ABC transporter permease [Gemmatimonas sp.]
MPQLEIQIIAVVTALACALPGAFLVLRRVSMLSDAISHAILPGIVLAFFLTEDLNSPLLILGAAVTGVITAGLIEALNRTGRVREDAAIGLVFPVLFSIGVILIARYAGGVHLDIDAVLLGELAFAPFDRIVIGGRDLGPKALWVMGSVLLVNTAFITTLYKELKLSTFDPPLAAALGFSPVLLHYLLMGAVSVTAVGAFDAVGSILVVALVVGPPATAYLLTDSLARLLLLSAAIGTLAALVGYWASHLADASIAGSMATVVGIFFFLAYLFAPQQGVIAAIRRARGHRRRFAQQMLLVHLLHHEDTPEASRECQPEHLQEHLRWNEEIAGIAIKSSLRDRLVVSRGGLLHLTSEGREIAREAMVA